MHSSDHLRVLLAPDRCTRYLPAPVEQPRRRHLIGIWAHPDDESYLSAGLMAQAVDAGDRVTLVTLTDGEGGFAADDPRSAADKSQLRRRELTAAMRHIGVDDIRFVGIADGRVAADGGDSLVTLLRELMTSIRPDLVVTFGPEGITGHDDHVATWRAVTRAWLDIGLGELWYAVHTRDWLDEWRDVHDEFGIWMTGEPDGIAAESTVLQLEMSGRELDRKRRVLAEHASQTGAIAGALGEGVYRSWIRQESFRHPTSADLVDAVEPARHEVAMMSSVAP